MKKTSMLLMTIVFLGISISTLAWGPTGHRVVGQIAESYLSNKARIAIREIFGTETIAMSSNWADFIKSDSAYNYLYSWQYINFKQGLSQTAFNSVLQNDNATNAFTKLNFL